MRKYKRITYTDRLKIEALYNAKHTYSSIAKELGFTPSGIYREVQHGLYQHKNHDWTYTKKYSAEKAHRYYKFNNTTKGAQLKLGNDYHFVAIVEDLILNKKLSPDSALAYMKRNNIVTKTKICLTTLYSYINKGLFPNLTNKNLLCHGRRKNSKVAHQRRRIKKAPRGKSIEKRPAEINSRIEFGHWELDSVVGRRSKDNSLLVFTERKTRYEIIMRVKDKTAAATVRALNELERIYKSRFSDVFKTITVDNGSEFSDVLHMEQSIYGDKKRTQFYYCHPYCSCERGSNENANRIIRRFIPKGSLIKKYSTEAIRRVEEYINNLPRRILGYKTANELYLSELKSIIGNNW